MTPSFLDGSLSMSPAARTIHPTLLSRYYNRSVHKTSKDGNQGDYYDDNEHLRAMDVVLSWNMLIPPANYKLLN